MFIVILKIVYLLCAQPSVAGADTLAIKTRFEDAQARLKKQQREDRVRMSKSHEHKKAREEKKAQKIKHRKAFVRSNKGPTVNWLKKTDDRIAERQAKRLSIQKEYAKKKKQSAIDEALLERTKKMGYGLAGDSE